MVISGIVPLLILLLAAWRLDYYDHEAIWDSEPLQTHSFTFDIMYIPMRKQWDPKALTRIPVMIEMLHQKYKNYHHWLHTHIFLEIVCVRFPLIQMMTCLLWSRDGIQTRRTVKLSFLFLLIGDRSVSWRQWNAALCLTFCLMSISMIKFLIPITPLLTLIERKRNDDEWASKWGSSNLPKLIPQRKKRWVPATVCLYHSACFSVSES